ncbi:unnamed protein product, partial [Closterium sp. Yama58-4]
FFPSSRPQSNLSFSTRAHHRMTPAREWRRTAHMGRWQAGRELRIVASRPATHHTCHLSNHMRAALGGSNELALRNGSAFPSPTSAFPHQLRISFANKGSCLYGTVSLFHIHPPRVRLANALN